MSSRIMIERVDTFELHIWKEGGKLCGIRKKISRINYTRYSLRNIHGFPIQATFRIISRTGSHLVSAIKVRKVHRHIVRHT